MRAGQRQDEGAGRKVAADTIARSSAGGQLAKALMGESSKPQCWAKRIKSYGSAGLVGGASWAGFSDFFAGFTLPVGPVNSTCAWPTDMDFFF